MILQPGRGMQDHGVLRDSQAERGQREAKESGATLECMGRRAMRVFKEFLASQELLAQLDLLA